MSGIVVVGGTGTIGTQVVRLLRASGEDVSVASRARGVDIESGQGLSEALRDARIVIDLSKTRSSDPRRVDEFFSRAGENLTRAEKASGVEHHVMLSIVGSDRAPGVPFYAAKVRLEQAIRAGEVPCTILHATQFFEFAPAIAESSSVEGDGTIRIPPLRVQPVAGADVASVIVRLASAAPSDRDIDLAGPERFELDDFVRAALARLDQRRAVVRDPDARYFGGVVERDALLPGPDAQIAPTRWDDWLAGSP